MGREPVRLEERLLHGCFAVLIGAMALYGAAKIIASIWLALCVGTLVIASIYAAVWIFISRFRRW